MCTYIYIYIYIYIYTHTQEKEYNIKVKFTCSTIKTVIFNWGLNKKFWVHSCQIVNWGFTNPEIFGLLEN